MEGSAVAIRHNLSVGRAAGADVQQLYASGGPTRSEPWCQIIADVTGQPLRVVESGGAPVGDALIAGVGAGLIADAGEMARRMGKVELDYTVPTAYHARYYPTYQ